MLVNLVFPETLKQVDKWLLERADVRTRDWAFVGSVDGLISMITLYLITVSIGPKYMAKYKPFDLKSLMLVYNLALVALSLWMFWQFFAGSIDAGYNVACTPMKFTTDPKEMRIANAMWFYYISKYIEFCDTLFMILRKKNNQISFLHIYHHFGMAIIFHLVMLFGAGGNAAYAPCINSLVHVVMYTYYGLSGFESLRPYLWWKKYLTMFQIAQFCALIFITFLNCVTPCDFPMFLEYIQFFFCLSLLVLFSNFYIQSYLRKRRRNSRAAAVSMETKREMLSNGNHVKNGKAE